MKILLLAAGGKGGSDFFQGHLDNHSQILQFPGHFLINKNFYKLLKKASRNNFKETAKFFTTVYLYFFNSKLNKYERHDKLGENKKINFIFLPMKCEILVWKNCFKHRKIKQLLSIPYYYLKRILIINKIIIKSNKLPYSIGAND